MRAEENNNVDYTKNRNDALAVLNQLIEHKKWSAFKSTWPDFLYGKNAYKRNFFKLMVLLNLMGFESKFEALREKLRDGNKSAEEQLQDVFEELNKLFEFISNQAKRNEKDGTLESASQEATLKKLTQLIREFSHHNQLGFRLYDLDKLKLNGQTTLVDSIRSKSSCERKYAYIPADRENAPASIEYDTARVKVKGRLNKLSFAISLTVAIGEGIVAAAFAAVAFPLVLSLFIIGIPAFLCNFYLFKKDSFEILKGIWFGKIWKKPNGESLSLKEKIFVSCSLVFSLGAGLSFGLLSFGAGIKGFPAFLAILGIASANPIGIMVLAGFVALVTSVALFTVFSYLVVKWVRNDGPKKLWNRIKGLKDDFIQFCKHENWSQLTLLQKCGHVFKKTLASIGHFILGIFTIAPAILVNIALIRFMGVKSQSIFQTVFKFNNALSKKLAYAITIGIGGIINTIFYSKHVISLVNTIKSTLKAIFVHPIKTLKKVVNYWRNNTATQTAIKIIRGIKRLFLVACCALPNAYGQGSGVGNSHAVGVTLKPLTAKKISDSLCEAAGGTTLGSASFNMNATACVGATDVAKDVFVNPARVHGTTFNNNNSGDANSTGNLTQAGEERLAPTP